MSGEYEKAITIEKAISQIVERRYLLLAILRKFTWSSSQKGVNPSLFCNTPRQYYPFL